LEHLVDALEGFAESPASWGLTEGTEAAAKARVKTRATAQYLAAIRMRNEASFAVIGWATS
jgi:hypothetical protein